MGRQLVKYPNTYVRQAQEVENKNWSSPQNWGKTKIGTRSFDYLSVYFFGEGTRCCPIFCHNFRVGFEMESKIFRKFRPDKN